MSFQMSNLEHQTTRPPLNYQTPFILIIIIIKSSSEHTLCKIQYVEKVETLFNIRLNNHRKDANGNNPKAIPASIHFKQAGHNFNKHAKFTLIEEINNTINTDIDKIKIKLNRREEF